MKSTLLIILCIILVDQAFSEQPPAPAASPKWTVSYGDYWVHHEQLTNQFAVAMLQAGKTTGSSSPGVIARESFDLATAVMDLHGIKTIQRSDNMPPPERQQMMREPTQFPFTQPTNPFLPPNPERAKR